jgi:hypothetical protein
MDGICGADEAWLGQIMAAVLLYSPQTALCWPVTGIVMPECFHRGPVGFDMDTDIQAPSRSVGYRGQCRAMPVVAYTYDGRHLR